MQILRYGSSFGIMCRYRDTVDHGPEFVAQLQAKIEVGCVAPEDTMPCLQKRLQIAAAWSDVSNCLSPLINFRYSHWELSA